MLLFERFNLGHGFRRHFRIAPALDAAARERSFRLRHEVYCEELKFSPLRPDGLDTDGHDARSLHCLLSTRSAPDQAVGSIRVIRAGFDGVEAMLPFEQVCAHSLDRSIVDPARLPRSAIGQVSHLAVRAAFRRRQGESHSIVEIHADDFGIGQRPRFPYVPIGLYLGAMAMASRSGIDTLFVLAEPRLATHFTRLGVRVRKIGNSVEHHGLRVPLMVDVPSTIRHMSLIVKPIWRVIQDEIELGHEQAAGGSALTGQLIGLA